MEQAIKVYSAELGYFSETIKATEIKSYSHARKIAPFVDENGCMMYWVNWGKPKKNNKPRVAHFKHYSNGVRTLSKNISNELKYRYKASKESSKHKKAKESVLLLLKNLLESKKHLPWSYIDPEISQFPMSGDFLAGAVSIESEYPVHSPFGKEYRLDVAILGKPILNNPVILAGIELEFTHKFDFSKSMICKSLGFPLISIDILEVDEDDINTGWAKKSLIETTANSDDGYRRNYIYIHRMLSTVFVDIPRELVPESRHQYVIFSDEHDKLISYLNRLKERLNLSDKQVIISPVEDKNKQLHIQVDNAGNLAGESWKDHNKLKFIQLTIDKPCNKSGKLYYFHLTLAFLCNSIFDCLVGYKYEVGQKHEIGDVLHWVKTRRINNKLIKYRLAPKRVSEPIKQILLHVDR